MTDLSFEALYYGDRLQLVNPSGDIGVITLWSSVRAVMRRIEAAHPTLLDPATSRIAVITNLYGDGMYAMFANLLHNPQLRHVLVLGQDLGLPTADELSAFVDHGTEAAELHGQPVRRIIGTDRLLPDHESFDEARLRRQLSVHRLGRLSEPGFDDALAACVADLPVLGPVAPDRVVVEMEMGVAADHRVRPSVATGHQVIRARPLDVWRELVVRVAQFGRPVELANGPRLELLNVKAVITDPTVDEPAAVEAAGFAPAQLAAYQQAILDPVLPEGVSYTYGNRLRGHFDADGRPDTLARVVELLQADPESRHAYLSLWDTPADLLGERTGSVPCLTTLFFRRSEGRLTLTATYRVHNLLVAWLQNAYGLMAIQRHVADQLGWAAGPVTVVSHSLGIDPRSPRYAPARALAESWSTDDDIDQATGRTVLRQDPNGHFLISADPAAGTVVAEHWADGILLGRYEDTTANKVSKAIARDLVISLPSHALWVGLELARAEQRLGRSAAAAEDEDA